MLKTFNYTFDFIRTQKNLNTECSLSCHIPVYTPAVLIWNILYFCIKKTILDDARLRFIQCYKYIDNKAIHSFN